MKKYLLAALFAGMGVVLFSQLQRTQIAEDREQAELARRAHVPPTAVGVPPDATQPSVRPTK